MRINPKQLAAIIALTGEERYQYFVKVVSDWQEVWGLYMEGWALAGTDDGATVFPMWPAKEYAEACAENEWAGYEPKSFSLDELLNDLLPRLKSDGMLPGVFFVLSGKGVTPSVDQLALDIKVELQNY
ncbi:conserved hypothetical protein [Pseudomonas sp. 8Z]|uniref:DUF2750 domain-containing protein n=1 Tax=Pseudomonas sp. 8Z TaxID=2653166 RepID=UPI0012F41342|nr:DUF2750 domain-containing protein [Pseudomonas sp. 8Z]VXC85437.1 conserved hypothetical protein [Pseudomonas sp. 8Z]